LRRWSWWKAMSVILEKDAPLPNQGQV